MPVSEVSEIPFTLTHGNAFPFDATDKWWKRIIDDVPLTPATDWAHYAARGVLADLTDRRGIKDGFNDLDEDVRIEIVQSLADVIRAAPTAFADITDAPEVTLMVDGEPCRGRIVTHGGISIQPRDDESNWQPIETAPKNGSHVLLYCDYYGVGRCAWESWRGVWRSDDPNHGLGYPEPSHWMPLPDAPPGTARAKQ